MQVKRDFTTWMKSRIEQYSFVENEDFILTLTKTGEQVFTKTGENLGGRPSSDFHITLDMGKELAMVERNEFGKAARRYFIALERQAKAARPALALSTVDDRKPLKDSVNRFCKKYNREHADVWRMVHERFAVDNVEQLPASKIEYAVGYLHALEAEFNKHLPTVVSFTGAGRFLTYIDRYNDNCVTVKDVEGYSLVEVDIVDKLQRDLRTMQTAMADLATRLRLVTGEESARCVEQPPNITLTA